VPAQLGIVNPRGFPYKTHVATFFHVDLHDLKWIGVRLRTQRPCESQPQNQAKQHTCEDTRHACLTMPRSVTKLAPAARTMLLQRLSTQIPKSCCNMHLCSLEPAPSPEKEIRKPMCITSLQLAEAELAYGTWADPSICLYEMHVQTEDTRHACTRDMLV
jgi:hypothetical protein